MKRDYDLIRMILQDVEAIPAGGSAGGFEYAGFDSETIKAHVLLMADAGLITATVLPMASGQPKFKVLGLTWAGHDFLESTNKPGLWDRAKEVVIKPGGGAAFGVLSDWLKDRATEALRGL